MGRGQDVAGKIFISYRRSDSKAITDRIYSWLAEQFGRDHVFYDIDTIGPGVDWRAHIREEVGKARVVLAIISRSWLAEMQARAADPQDVLRFELETALARGISVVPVLIERTEMPRAAELPASLGRMPGLNAVTVHEARYFFTDMDALAERLAAGWGFERRMAAAVVAKEEPVIVDDPETRLWRISKNSLEAKTYEQFLERYPTAAQSPEARRRLEDIYGWQRTDKTEPVKIHEYIMSGPIAPLANIAMKELEISKDKYVQKKAAVVRENLMGQAVFMLGIPFALVSALACSQNFWIGHIFGVTLNEKMDLIDIALVSINFVPTFAIPAGVVGINYLLQRGEIKRAMDQRKSYWKRELGKY